MFSPVLFLHVKPQGAKAGIRGDRVTLIETIPAFNRVEVTFASGVTGWVDTSNVIFDWFSQLTRLRIVM